MGPNKEVVVKNLIQKRITPLTRVSLEALVIMNEVISMVVQLSEEQEELKLAEEALKDEANGLMTRVLLKQEKCPMSRLI